MLKSKFIVLNSCKTYCPGILVIIVCNTLLQCYTCDKVNKLEPFCPGNTEWKWWDGTGLPLPGDTDAYHYWIDVEPNVHHSQKACVSLTPYGTINTESNIKDACSSNPCVNGGNCSRNVVGFTCQCQPEYIGPNCDQDLCQPMICQNGGTCNRLPLNYSCSCLPGYSGRNCETDIYQPTTCQNGGTCNRLPLDYNCSCLPGYSGRNCDTDACSSNPCVNGGNCSRNVDGYICQCQPGYIGRNCDQDLCGSSPCQNNGTCNKLPQNYSCSCSPSFTGANCESALFYPSANGCELHINKIPSQATSYKEAETQCTTLQASLAIVKSNETQINLNHVHEHWLDNITLWIGGKTINSTWLWSDGSNMDGYNNWVEQSAPHDAGCLSLAQNGSWFAKNCSTITGYACERRVNGTSLCAFSPCANGGVCTESGCHFHCTCQHNFSGSNCEILELSAGTNLVVYIIPPICVIIVGVAIALICIRKRSHFHGKRGRETAEVPAVQFAPDSKNVYEDILSTNIT